MPHVEPGSEPEIAEQILSYFVRNPKARDSLEGVARWRLLQEQIHRSLLETEAALAWLLSEGYLQQVQTPGSASIFQLNPDRYSDAIQFLADQRKRQAGGSGGP